MSPRSRQILFTLFAPLTVPAYVLFLAGSNLLGGAFYIVVEASWSKLIGRPVSLSRGWMAVLAVPVLAAAPFAAAFHLILAFFAALGKFLAGLGHWQAGFQTRSWSVLSGALWILAALWTTMTCLNAAVGMGWIGRGVSEENKRDYVDHILRYRVLGEMPESMQARRKTILEEFARYREEIHPNWERWRTLMADDEFPFAAWRPETPLKRAVKADYGKRLAGIPWYFEPRQFSNDGLEHSELMFGQLIFVWMLLIRWPGMFFVLRARLLTVLWFLLRTIGAVISVYYLASWEPSTVDQAFLFLEDIPGWFVLLSPATWIGGDYMFFVKPEWVMFNAGLWMIVLGLVILLWWLAWRVSPFLGWPRYYVAFLASRLLQRKRIAFFSVGAVTLCVAMMIIVISVMGGFVDSIRDRANGLLGDLVVDGGLRGFPFYEEFIKEVGKLRDEKTGEPIVEQATPIIMTYGVLKFSETNETSAVSVRGVRLDEYVRVNEFGNDLFYQKRYGGTKLDVPMAKPVYGVGEDWRAVLPGDMDEHYEKYLASLPPEQRAEEEARYGRDKDGIFRGPGVFSEPSQELGFKPGYEGDLYPGMIIGRDVFLRRRPSGEYDRDPRHYRGEPCYLTMIPLSRTGDVLTEAPPRPVFRYVDDSKTGIHEIDSRTVYVDFDLLQEILMMGSQERLDGTKTSPRCSQVQIKLKDEFAEPKQVLHEKKNQVMDVWLRIEKSAPADDEEVDMMQTVHVSTWEEMQETYIQAIEKEKFLVVIMFGVISTVAVFLILCIFYMIVQEKTRDVGIIKSVGGSTEGVAAVFLVYGAAIGLVGCVLGSLLGVAFVEHINEIQNWLARINPDWRVWSPETYSFEKIPSEWKWSEVLWISVLAVVASVVGAAFPAIRAGRTWPVESLRYE